MPKRLSQEDYRMIFSKVRRLCVDVVIRHEGGTVLTKRSIEPAKGMWHIPGGTVLWGETLDEAVVRVAKEEAGLDVVIEKRTGIVKEYTEATGFGQPASILFIAKSVSGKMKHDENASEIKVFEEIPNNTIPEHIELLKEVGMK